MGQARRVTVAQAEQQRKSCFADASKQAADSEALDTGARVLSLHLHIPREESAREESAYD